MMMPQYTFGVMILPMLLVGLFVTTAWYHRDLLQVQQQQKQQQNRQQQLRRQLESEAQYIDELNVELPLSASELLNEGTEQISNQKQQKPNVETVGKSHNNEVLGNNSTKTLDNDKIALALQIQKRKDASSSFYHYYQKCSFNHPLGDLMILHWDSNGQLDPYSLKDTTGDHNDWWDGNFTFDQITTHDHREYGTLAMLLDTDDLSGLPYESVKPPVPILFYTIYNGLHNSSNYRVIVNPTEKLDRSRWPVVIARQGANATPFHDKKSVIVWRGVNHGEPLRTKLLSISAPYLNAVDAGAHPEEHLSEADMSIEYKYQLDIPGASGTSWGGFRWKLCSGNLVFKIETFARDWWYDYLVPWEHYVPIREDLSDLEENYQWAESHPDEAYAIAQAGAKVCMDTYEKSFMDQYEANVIQSLPPATKELYDELMLIREGYLQLSGAP